MSEVRIQWNFIVVLVCISEYFGGTVTASALDMDIIFKT